MKNSIYQYFQSTAVNKKEKIAIIEADKSWTFDQTFNEAEILRAILLEKITKKNEIIAIYLKKSYYAIVSDLAVMGVGCAYMNLDVKSPEDRIQKILENIQPTIIITDKKGQDFLKRFKNENILVLNLEDNEISKKVQLFDKKNQLNKKIEEIIDVDPCCIINTSGSTGTPKGVILNHRSFIDFVNWSENYLKINGDEIVGSLSPIIFDIFSFELCMLAFHGSTLVLIDEKLSPYPYKILEILENNKVSFIFWVPTIMVNIVNLGLLDKFELKNLKTVWFAGEVFPTVHFNKWFDKLKNVEFVNLYGPIEITLDCTYFIIDKRIKDDQPIPMGYACQNTSLLILNENGEEVEEGEIGELHVRGTSLAMGYYNNMEQTSKSFIQNPLNNKYPELIYKTGDLVIKKEGIYYFKGRSDTLIKHNGYRIELTEIEHIILNSVEKILNVCVIYDGKEIIAFCEVNNELSFNDFRSSLIKKLPSYMIPTKLNIIDRMPMNTNGKIDRLFFKVKDNCH